MKKKPVSGSCEGSSIHIRVVGHNSALLCKNHSNPICPIAAHALVTHECIVRHT